MVREQQYEYRRPGYAARAEPASARGLLAEDDAEYAAAHTTRTAPDSYYEPFQASYMGEARQGMRHVVEDHADEPDAEPAAGHRGQPASYVARSGARDYLDVYAELGHPPLREDPDAIAEFQRDLMHPRLQAAFESNTYTKKAPPPPPPPPGASAESSAPPPPAREQVVAERLARMDTLRRDIAQAMLASRSTARLFSTDYTRSVPPAHLAVFVALREVQAIVSTLLPVMYVPTPAREHFSEAALADVLGCVGCFPYRASSLKMPFAAFAEHAAEYDEDDTHVNDAHTHVVTVTTGPAIEHVLPMRVLSYLAMSIAVPRAASANAGTTTANRRILDALDPVPLGLAAEPAATARKEAGTTLVYLLDVVAHELGASGKLCVRTFAFRSELLPLATVTACMKAAHM